MKLPTIDLKELKKQKEKKIEKAVRALCLHFQVTPTLKNQTRLMDVGILINTGSISLRILHRKVGSSRGLGTVQWC